MREDGLWLLLEADALVQGGSTSSLKEGRLWGRCEKKEAAKRTVVVEVSRLEDDEGEEVEEEDVLVVVVVILQGVNRAPDEHAHAYDHA